MIALLRRQLGATVGVLASLRGNARAVVATEPIWAVPYNLVQTYAAVYMLALGCTATQVGLIGTVGFAMQMPLSLASGWITDRLGRKRTTILFDLFSWTIPAVLWGLARGFSWFLAAAVVNSFVRIVHTSWGCLFIEDTPPARRVHVYTWVAVAGVVAGFVTPVAGLLVGRFGLVPAMRGMHLAGGAVMTGMFLLRNAMVRETAVGRRRMRETRHHRIGETTSEYLRVGLQALRTPLTVEALALAVVASVASFLRVTFQPIVFIGGLGFPEAGIAVFPAVNAVVMLVVFVFVMPTLTRGGVARPLALGFAALAAGVALLAASPARSLPVALAATAIGGVGQAIAFPLADTLLANVIRERDRAKVMSICYVLIFAASAPFGWIGGRLAEASARLPFALAAGVCLLGAVLALAAARGERRSSGSAGR